MERAIIGYQRDEIGDWVAQLDCGHRQHVRHRPPFQWREWILDARTRKARLGTPLPCPLCDRAELPETIEPVRNMECDETTLASGLRLNRQGALGTWGRIFVRTGRLRFRAATDPPIEVELEPGTAQAIPPGVEHDIVPTGPVRFTLEFLADKSNRSDMHAAGGDDE